MTRSATVLTEAPRADVPALILAEAALAQELGWDLLLPLLASGLKRPALRKQGDDLRLACYHAVVSSAAEAVRLASDLARRSAHLKAVAPRLRAKGAGEAVDMFLARDALGPAFAGPRGAAALRSAGRTRRCARADRARHLPALRAVNMAKVRPEPALDCELADLPPELRWREWMCRIEAVLFASAAPVSRGDLAQVVGQGASVDLLIEDLAAGLGGRAFEIARVAGGWMFRTRSEYATAIRGAADVGDQMLGLSEFELADLAAIAYHQPITRDGLKDVRRVETWITLRIYKVYGTRTTALNRAMGEAI